MALLLPLTADHWPDVAAIYAAGLETGLASFETVVPTWAVWHASHLPAPRLVALDDRADDPVVGWAALSPASPRSCYRGVAEVAVYVAEDSRRRGIGRALLERLVADAPAHGIWTVQAAIFALNEPSIALHERCGFRLVGRRERIAQRDGIWHDTVLLELRLP